MKSILIILDLGAHNEHMWNDNKGRGLFIFLRSLSLFGYTNVRIILANIANTLELDINCPELKEICEAICCSGDSANDVIYKELMSAGEDLVFTMDSAKPLGNLGTKVTNVDSLVALTDLFMDFNAVEELIKDSTNVDEFLYLFELYPQEVCYVENVTQALILIYNDLRIFGVDERKWFWGIVGKHSIAYEWTCNLYSEVDILDTYLDRLDRSGKLGLIYSGPEVNMGPFLNMVNGNQVSPQNRDYIISILKQIKVVEFNPARSLIFLPLDLPVELIWSNLLLILNPHEDHEDLYGLDDDNIIEFTNFVHHNDLGESPLIVLWNDWFLKYHSQLQ